MRKIREVLRLSHACGLSERRIALAVGLSRSTVKSYVQRAAAAGIAWPLPAEIDDASSGAAVVSADGFAGGCRAPAA